ncbi:MAG: 30S ribosomal protein S16 [bacterium]|nr:30S ribosomal protein S16 [bacterium]
MVKIRLMRMGAKKSPFYRVVVADSRSARGSRFIENLGHYDPTKNPQVVKLNEDRVIYWLGEGAQPTDTAKSLLRKQGILKRMHEAKTGTAPAEEASEAAASEEA